MAGGDLQLSYQPNDQSYSYAYLVLRSFAVAVTSTYSSAIKLYLNLDLNGRCLSFAANELKPGAGSHLQIKRPGGDVRDR